MYKLRTTLCGIPGVQVKRTVVDLKILFLTSPLLRPPVHRWIDEGDGGGVSSGARWASKTNLFRLILIYNIRLRPFHYERVASLTIYVYTVFITYVLYTYVLIS